MPSDPLEPRSIIAGAVSATAGTGLLGAEGKALIEAKKPVNQKYQNYLRTRWLPSRLKLAGMLGLAIGGGAMLWKDIHEQSRD